MVTAGMTGVAWLILSLSWFVVFAFSGWAAFLGSKRLLKAGAFAWFTVVPISLISHLWVLVWPGLRLCVKKWAGTEYDLAPWLDEGFATVGLYCLPLWIVGLIVYRWRKSFRFSSRRLARWTIGTYIALMIAMSGADWLSNVGMHFWEPVRIAQSTSPDGKSTVYLMILDWLDIDYEFHQGSGRIRWLSNRWHPATGALRGGKPMSASHGPGTHAS